MNVNRTELDAARAELEALNNMHVQVSVGVAVDRASLTALRAELDQISGTHVTAHASVQTDHTSLDALRAELSTIDGTHATATADTNVNTLSLDMFEARLRAFAAFHATALADVNVNNTALTGLTTQLASFSGIHATATADVNTNDGDLAGTIARLSAFGGSHYTAHADVDTDRATSGLHSLTGAASGTSSALSGIGGASGGASSGISSVGGSASSALGGLSGMQSAITALVVIIISLLPVLGGVAVGLVAFAGAFAIVLGALAPVISALGAFGQQQKAAGTQSTNTASTVVANAQAIAGAQRQISQAQSAAGQVAQQAAQQQIQASEQIKNAEMSLADAKRSAAMQAINSANSIINAEQSLVTAEQSERTAQVALTQARVDARFAMDNLNNSVKDGALSLRAANLQVQQAAQNLRAVIANSGSTTLMRQQAQLAYDQAKQGVTDQQTRLGQLTIQQKASSQAGINGSKQVVSATQAESSARQAVSNAERALQTARAQASDAAIRASEGIQKAQQAVADAQRNAANVAANAAYQQQQAQQRIRDAEQALADMRQRQALQYQQQQGANSSAVNKFAQDMQKLTPAGRELVGMLEGLQGKFSILAQNAFLPGFNKFVRDILTLGPIFSAGMTKMGNVLGDFFAKLGQFMASPVFRGELNSILNQAAGFMKVLLGAVNQFIPALSRLMSVSGPATMALASGFASIIGTGLPGFFKALEPGIAAAGSIFKSLSAIVSAFLPFLGQLASAFAVALAPALKAIVPLFQRMFTTLGAQLMPIAVQMAPILGQMVKMFVQMEVAMLPLLPALGQLLVAALKLLIAVITPLLPLLNLEAKGMTLVAQGLAFVVKGVAIAVTAFASLITKLTTTSGIWVAIWHGMQTAYQAVLNAMKVAFSAFIGAMSAASNAFLGAIKAAWSATWGAIRTAVFAVWNAIRAAAGAFWGFVKSQTVDYLNAIRSIWGSVWNGIKTAAIAVWNAIRSAAGAFWAFIKSQTTDYLNAIKSIWNSVWNAIKGLAVGLWNAIRSAAGAFWSFIKSQTSDYLGAIKSLWSGAWSAIKSVFSTFASGIKSATGALMSALKAAWEGGAKAIGAAWSVIKKLVRDPIQAVVNVVYTKGIQSLWNKVAGVFHAPSLPDFHLPGFARGGPVNGPGTGTSDSVVARLSHNEHVWTSAEVDGAGGHEVVAGLRSAALGGSQVRKSVAVNGGGNNGPLGHQNAPGFALGGGIHIPGTNIDISANPGDWVKGAIKGFDAAVGFGANVLKDLEKLGMGAVAAAVNPLIQKVADGAKDVVKKITPASPLRTMIAGGPAGIVSTGGPNPQDTSKNTQGALTSHGNGFIQQMADMVMSWIQVNDIPVGGANVADAQKWADAQVGKPYSLGGFGATLDCSSFMSGIAQVILGKTASPLFTTFAFTGAKQGPATFERNLTAPFMVGVENRGVGHMAGTLNGKNYEATPPKVRSGPSARGAHDSMFDMVYGMKASMGGGGSGVIPTGQHLQIIDAALAAAGVPPPGSKAQWEAGMNTIIVRESNWNSSAQNNTDSNASAGTPSKGLAQVIQPTFNANHVAGTSNNIFDPVANVAAAIRYIVRQYGNISNVQQADPSKPPKGYRFGIRSALSGWHPVGENGMEMMNFGGGGQSVRSFKDTLSDTIDARRPAGSDSGGDVDNSVTIAADAFTFNISGKDAEEIKQAMQSEEVLDKLRQAVMAGVGSKGGN